MSVITTIEDLRVLAKRRVPKMFFDYMASGSWTETTLRQNMEDFEKIAFRQRVAVDLSNRTVQTSMLGETVTMPVALAPTGLAGMQHANGEILAAKAATNFGVPFTLSTMSICSVEDLADNVQSPFWFQLYVMRDRNFSHKLVSRAQKAGCSALIVTLDLQVMGQRHQDIKNGLTTPPRLTLRNIVDMMKRPAWSWGMLNTKRRQFGNIVGHVDGVSDLSSLAAWTAEQFDPSLSWEDIARIRDLWQGKFVLKGIMDPEDAAKGLEIGADAIIVSNHGGRQLDGSNSTISALPGIAEAVGKNAEVWVDGGIRTGQDVLKAIALGADATLIGRSYLYGLGALGERGVTQALEILHKELDMTMALCGHRVINEVDRDIFSRCPF
tara:strand:- start:4873 stop:6018 length:1146 start_codon:yes stop_codon:yes gene_type:complete